MALFSVAVLLGLVVVVPALVAGLVLAVTAHRDVGADQAARRHDSLITLATVLAALLTAVGVLSLPVTWTASFLPTPEAAGMLFAAGPFAVAVVACLVRTAGELTWPRPQDVVRTAPLRRRTVRELGGWRLWTLLGTSALLVATLVATGLTATDGTTVSATRRDVPGGGWVEGSAGPYPGWPYGVPMLVGLAVTLGCAYLTLRVIVRRAPLDGLGHDGDDALRRTSAARLLGVLQLCVGGATALALVFAGSAARRAGTAHVAVDDGWYELVDPVLNGLGALALALGLAVAVGTVATAVTAVAVGRRRQPTTEPATKPPQVAR